ncbi:MAG: biopolymer transporter ExbD [Myxococcota bacterium]|nr:biopolymer transporter ExbD [Myxococcota bacterium]
MAKRRQHDIDAELNITSLMDIMTIILVFLLKSYSTEDIQIAPSDNLLLPVSSSKRPPELAVNAVVSKVAITVEGVEVVKVTGNEVQDQYKRGTLISPLFDILKAEADEAKANAEKTNGKFTGRLLLQVDRDIPFSLVREVMYTAGQAQFAEFKFVVYSGGGG